MEETNPTNPELAKGDEALVERLRADCDPRSGDDWPDYHGRVKPLMLEAAARIEAQNAEGLE